ncbi:MAG TPA: RsiV family protein [Defluviitaleaceae bacterium]|jgi:hypothetical protein|nr:DUF3298 domain-containing protein [Candidatus Epulonipiscium sp.]HOQ17698.1 RsiV family protein [Defluviitaleaceae bacterium]HPT77047.1 RsiV family protein [Defluviitaleaceae bacterium]HQD50887.1 RsiV family protein [Defluviitaleaceae bacterium]
MNNNLDELKRKYEEIEVPQNTLELVEKTIKKAKKKEKALNIFKDFGATLVAIVAILTILVNLNSNIAYGLSKLPILNVVVEVVNFRNYESKHKDMEANLNIPEISVKDEEGKILEESTKKINASIEEYTNKLISRYQEEVEATGGEGLQTVNLDYEIITNNERLFSIRFNELIVMASGNEKVKIFHLDKQTGEVIILKDLFREDANFKKIISDNIKEQMKKRMEEDENLTYWIDSEVPEWDFKSINDDTTFYINEKGKLVIVFDEYEVAPGFMGVQEFEIPTEIIKDFAKDGFIS